MPVRMGCYLHISILRNEKNNGDALLQKRFTVDFLTRQMKTNVGEVLQFYEEGSHEGIIFSQEFDIVQAEIERRKNLGRPARCNSIFAGKIACGDCCGLYSREAWGSYKEEKNYRKEVY